MTKRLRRTRTFEKHFDKRIARSPKLSSQFEERLAQFLGGVRTAPINDHALTGNMDGKRAFSITADIRVIYTETEDAFVFLDIGTHAQVYK
jgi:addiction module RelE/StbE family toxin